MPPSHRASAPRLLGLVLALLLFLPAGAVTIAAGTPPAATPAAEGPTVIEAPPPARRVAGSGDQTLRLAGPVDPYPTLDPAQTRDLSTAFLVRQVFRGLVSLGADLQPVPELADRIEIDPAGLVYTFRLRPGLTFHDGRPITADDLVASFTRALDPATAGASQPPTALGALGDIAGATELAAGRAADLAGARAVDERTVELRLAAPRATFLAKLAGPTAAVVDPRDPGRGADWWRSPNGSGPFRLASWEPGGALVLERFAGYVPGAPALARVEFRLGTAAAQPFNLYQAGEIDLVSIPPWAMARAEGGDSDLAGQVQTVPQFSTGLIAFRADAAPMDDPHLRRAVQLAFPRRLLAEVAYEGRVLAADGLVPPGMLGRPWPVAEPAVDPEAARRELAASRCAAVGEIPPIRIYTAGAGAAQALRDVLAEELGLRVEVVEVEWPDFNAGLAAGDFPAIELVWGADYPDPESFLWSLFGSGSPDNYVGFADPTFDDLLRQASVELDPERRIALYDQAHQRLIDSGVVIPLYHDVEAVLTAPPVRGLTVTPLGVLALDAVWLES